MKVGDLLEYLNGRGIILTDEDLIMESLNEIGWAIFDEIRTNKMGSLK